MHIKFFTWFFVFILCAAACAPQASPPQATEGIPTATSTSTPITVPVAVPKHQDLIFVEFFAGTWVDCRRMVPIVHELKKKYAGCIHLERVNFHDQTPWHELLSPFSSPEFNLLTASKDLIHRWFGVTEEEEFSAVLDPLCG